ncbi:uncharacterized protein LOC134727395 [Mytilus trossulus]|uniref:uncharacterized protein LOC134727395 n=1 Tax=Mytilus trossulus TaxID=6551 RepID=UPI00300559E7
MASLEELQLLILSGSKQLLVDKSESISGGSFQAVQLIYSMEFCRLVVICFFSFNVLLIGLAIGTTSTGEIHASHENISHTNTLQISVGRFKITSICKKYALVQESTFNIISDGHHINPPCSLNLIGVNYIHNNYSFSGMCYKMSDITLPCGRNDTLIIKGWALEILNTDQSILLYANQSMLVTEKTLRCDKKQDVSMNYEFCWEKVSMLEILFYSPNNPSSVLPKITVQSRILIGQTYPALSLHAMEKMTIQMDVHTNKTCKAKAKQVHLDFRDRDVLSGNNNNTNNNKLNKDEYNIKEETSIDVNVILAALFGAISTVAVALIGVRYNQARYDKSEEQKQTPHNQSVQVQFCRHEQIIQTLLGYRYLYGNTPCASKDRTLRSSDQCDYTRRSKTVDYLVTFDTKWTAGLSTYVKGWKLGYRYRSMLGIYSSSQLSFFESVDTTIIPRVFIIISLLQ